jgi:hypothetical protein
MKELGSKAFIRSLLQNNRLSFQIDFDSWGPVDYKSDRWQSIFIEKYFVYSYDDQDEDRYLLMK